MKRVAIFGMGGHGVSTLDLVASNVDLAFFFDDSNNVKIPKQIRQGSLDDLIIDHKKFDQIIVAIGNNNLRKKYLQIIEEKCGKHYLSSYSHNSSIISKYSQLSHGSTVYAGAIINSFATIGKGSIINSGSIIEHDCLVSEYSHIAPGAVLCGAVKIEGYCFIGANSVILPNLHIGRNSVIGAGSVITKNVDADSVIYGNPAKNNS